jgi:methylmalonyl-CoA mutase
MGLVENISLGEPANEADWRALVEKALKGAPWSGLTSHTADGIALKPLYREQDCPTASDISGFPGAAPFIRGATASRDPARPWLIRQIYDHPDPERVNRDILADLRGGVSSIELVIDPAGERGIAVRDEVDLDLALADVIPEAAPITLDAGRYGLWAAELLATKLKGVAAPGTAFNVDPIGTLMRTGAMSRDDLQNAALFAARMRGELPDATPLRVDVRPVHEAGGTEATEVAAALACGILYVETMLEKLSAEDGAASILFTLSVGPDVLVETAKLRALRLCWARVLEACGAAPEARAARIHAVTSKRMMTRYDAWTNIVRVTTAAFAAVIGGANAVTTLPFTNALGSPTPLARRIARNTQHVLLEESHLGHVIDPTGGAWFVEALTRELAQAAWSEMQTIQADGGILDTLTSGRLQGKVAEQRSKREAAFATRRETITGLTDFPQLGADPPAIEASTFSPTKRFSPPLANHDISAPPLAETRWATPFEDLRERAETYRRLPGGNSGGRLEAGGTRPSIFFANLGAPSEFSARSNFARNLFAIGGVGAIGPETEFPSTEALLAAFKQSAAHVAVICGTDARYGEDMPAIAEALRDAGCTHLILAGEPRGTHLIQQFISARCDVLAALASVHAALGIAP